MPGISEYLDYGKMFLDALLWVRKEVSKEAEHLYPRLRDYFSKRGLPVEIYPICSDLPRVIVSDNLVVPLHLNEQVARLRSTLALNELHAVLGEWDGLSKDSLRAFRCDFAQVEALRSYARERRNYELNPLVLSSGALLVCQRKRCVITHKRHKESATYGNCLHVLGGAFKPPVQMGDFDSPGDRKSLEFTMVREVFEESGIIVRRYKEPIGVMRELDTGFVQFVNLGVRITEGQFREIEQNSEGDIVAIGFDQLKGMLLEDKKWVPTGRAQILLWLGLGAPGAGLGARFGGQTAKELFDGVVV